MTSFLKKFLEEVLNKPKVFEKSPLKKVCL